MATDVRWDIVSREPSFRPWSAVDVEVEARLDHELCRPVNWRQTLMRWLIEFNKY